MSELLQIRKVGNEFSNSLQLKKTRANRKVSAVNVKVNYLIQPLIVDGVQVPNYYFISHDILDYPERNYKMWTYAVNAAEFEQALDQNGNHTVASLDSRYRFIHHLGWSCMYFLKRKSDGKLYACLLLLEIVNGAFVSSKIRPLYVLENNDNMYKISVTPVVDDLLKHQVDAKATMERIVYVNSSNFDSTGIRYVSCSFNPVWLSCVGITYNNYDQQMQAYGKYYLTTAEVLAIPHLQAEFLLAHSSDVPQTYEYSKLVARETSYFCFEIPKKHIPVHVVKDGERVKLPLYDDIDCKRLSEVNDLFTVPDTLLVYLDSVYQNACNYFSPTLNGDYSLFYLEK